MGAFPSHGHFLDLGMGSDLNLCLGTAMSGVLAKGLGRSLGLRVGGALALNCNLVRKALPIMNLPTEPLGRGSALARIALRFGTRAITTEPLLAFVGPAAPCHDELAAAMLAKRHITASTTRLEQQLVTELILLG